MKEVWNSIEGFNGRYQVSNLGRIICIRDKRGNYEERILRQYKDKNGYSVVNLYFKKGKLYYVHRLVAQNFIQNPNNLPQVNHKDENKVNNKVDNLEWCTNEYNSKYGTRTERAEESRQITLMLNKMLEDAKK